MHHTLNIRLWYTWSISTWSSHTVSWTEVERLALFGSVPATVCYMFWLCRRKPWRHWNTGSPLWLLGLKELPSRHSEVTDTEPQCQRSAPPRRKYSDPIFPPPRFTSCLTSFSPTAHTMNNWHRRLGFAVSTLIDHSYWILLRWFFYSVLNRCPNTVCHSETVFINRVMCHSPGDSEAGRVSEESRPRPLLLRPFLKASNKNKVSSITRDFIMKQAKHRS